MSYIKCLVHGCENIGSDGRFIRDMCAPCYEYITKAPIGKIQHSQAWRNAMETARLYEMAKHERIVSAIREIETLCHKELANNPLWYKITAELIK